MMMKSAYFLVFMLMLAVSAPVFSVGEARLFNFGPSGTEDVAGWVLVTDGDAYSPAVGYGWEAGIDLYPRNESHHWRGQGFLYLDPLTGTHITGGAHSNYPEEGFTFRVDTGAGEYKLAIIMGNLTERLAAGGESAITQSKPHYWFKGYTVRINGEEVYAREQDIGRHLEWFYSAVEEDFLPGDSIYERYVERYYPVRVFKVETEGSLEVEFSSVCPVNALFLYPAGMEDEFNDKLKEVREEARRFVDRQYTETVWEAGKEYRSPGSVMMAVTPAEELSAGLAAKYAGQGYILFSRPLEEVTPYVRPSGREDGRPAALFITPGDLARVNFSIFPLKDLVEVRVEPGDLVNAGGDVIPGGGMEVWLERYYTFPEQPRESDTYVIRPWYYTRYRGGMDFRTEVPRTFNVYFNIPEDAPPGDYRGSVRLKFNNAAAGEMPVLVKVLPFALDEPDALFGMYGEFIFGALREFAWDRTVWDDSVYREKLRSMMRTYLEEMRALGFNTIAPPGSPRRPFSINDAGEIIDARIFGSRVTAWDLWEDSFRIYREVFGDRPMPMYGIGHSLVSDRTAPGWVSRVSDWEKKGLSEEGIRNAERIVEHFYSRLRDIDGPEVIFYSSDELSNYGEKGIRMGLDWTSAYRKMADKLGFRLIASMNGPGEAVLLPYLDIACPNRAFNRPYPLNEDILARIRAAGCELWFYNIGDTRFSFGYYMAKTKAGGRLQWGFFTGDAYRIRIPFLFSMPRSHSYFSAFFDSNLDMARRNNMEEMRQGIVDYRYFKTLERLAGENKGSPAANKAERVMERILDEVKVDEVMEPWSLSTCERSRWMIASAIMEILEESR